MTRKDLNKYGRNNRTCIGLLDVNHFFDYTDPEYFYLSNDMLNLAHVVSGDVIRFNLHDNDNEDYKLFGVVVMACNISKTTFLVCRHYDDVGNEYIQDYKYSSFIHAFEKLNDTHSVFIPWEQLTNIKDVKTPHELSILWKECNHLDKEKVSKDTESKHNNLSVCYKNNNEVSITKKEYDSFNKTTLNMLANRVEYLEIVVNNLTDSLNDLQKDFNNLKKLI